MDSDQHLVARRARGQAFEFGQEVIGERLSGVRRSDLQFAVQRVRHVFTLGSPHRGATLEQAANVACSGLSMLPETRPFARPLKLRSAGIKDLRYGYLIDEEPARREPA